MFTTFSHYFTPNIVNKPITKQAAIILNLLFFLAIKI